MVCYLSKQVIRLTLLTLDFQLDVVVELHRQPQGVSDDETTVPALIFIGRQNILSCVFSFVSCRIWYHIIEQHFPL